MGREAHTIYKSFTFGYIAGENPERNYDIVMVKLHHYFIPKKNTIHERAKFNQMCQFPVELVEQYIRTLHDMTRGCNFVQNEVEHIRDKSYHNGCRLNTII